MAVGIACGMGVRASAQTELLIDYVVTPGHHIQHHAYYQGERELFGYNPSFVPNTVTFDQNNVPYIRYGALANGKTVISRSDQTRSGVVQTLDDQGNWIELSFIDDIYAAYPSWNGIYATGTHFEERVVFDDRGDAYMIVNHTRGSNINRNLLLHSRDKARTWDVYALPHPYGFNEWAFFEVPDGQSQMSGPPTIRLSGGGFDAGSSITLVKPTLTASGGLSIGSGHVPASNNNIRAGIVQAGLSNATATVGTTTYFAYAGMDPVSGVAGTPQYIMSYDNQTGQQISAPRLLGGGGAGAPDVHNTPGVAVDSDGYIHVLFGTHHGRIEYTRSNQSNTIDGGFTSPTFVGKNPSSGGYTYLSMVIDQDDTIHVVARYSGDNNKWALDYLRKKADGTWEDRGHLVQTFHSNYSTWDQKLTIDEQGRLFLRYSFYGDQLTNTEADVYRAKWPDEPISRISGSSYWNGIMHHDPVILMSDDHGDTWRIATTADFVNGIVPEPTVLALWSASALLLGRGGRSYRRAALRGQAPAAAEEHPTVA